MAETATQATPSPKAVQSKQMRAWTSAKLETLLWPIVFLSWLPFISSNMILQDTMMSGFEGSELRKLMRVFPHYDLPLIVMLSIIGAAAAFISCRKSWVFVVAALPLVPLLYYAWDLEAVSPFILSDGNGTSQPETGILAVFSFAYSLTVVASVLVFCAIGEMTDSFFWPFYVVAFFDCILAMMGSEFTVYGLLLTNYWPSIIGVALSFMAIFFARAAVIAIKHNQGIQQKFESEIRPAALKAFKLWWPMLLFFAVVTGGYYYLETSFFSPKIVSYLNDFERIEAVDGDVPVELPAAEVPAEQLPGTIDGALKALVERLAKRTTEKTEQAIFETSKNINGGSKEARDNATSSIRGAMPERFPGTQPVGCPWYDVVCHLGNGIKSMTNRAYVRARDRQLDRMQAELDSLYMDQEIRNEEYAGKFEKIARARIEQIKETSQQAIEQSAKTLLWLGWAMTAYGILVLFKSFLVVFARVLYFRHTVTQDDDPGKEVFGKVSTSTDTFRIPNNCPTRYYVKSSAIGVNVVERKRMPLPFKLPFVRLRTGAYVLSYIDTSAEFQDACDIRVDAPAELAVWELAHDEIVALRFADFIAMSEGTRLRSAISLRLSSLIFGRIIYHYACGPGVLILRTRSRAIVGNDPVAASSLNASGLVAWNIKNEYNVISNLSIVDTFFSGCSLRKTEGDLIVYDSSRTRLRGSLLSGAWRFGRTFLLPI